MTTLIVAHVFGVVLWAGGLIAVSHLLWRGRPRPALYRRLAAPGAFLALLTGIWMLHQDRPLLTMQHMHLKAAGIGLLVALDALCQWAISKPPAKGWAAGLHGAVIAVSAIVAALSFMRPDGP